MADTGSTQFPNSPRLDGKAGNTSAKNVLSAALIGAPNANKGAEDKIQHLRGTVINQNDKGQVRIQTEKGIVEVQLPKESKGRDAPLRQGQKVEVEIPPEKVRSRAPDSVKIKTDTPTEAPKERTTQTQTTAPSTDTAQPKTTTAQSTTNTANTEAAPPKQGQPPELKANIQVQKPSLADASTQSTLQQSTVEGVKKQTTIALSKLVGETIRLDPLQPNQTAQIITPEIQIMPQAISAGVMEALNQIINIDIETEQMQNLLGTPKPPPIQTAPMILDTQGSAPQPQNNIINQIISETIKPALLTLNAPQEQNAPSTLPQSADTISFNKVAPKPIDFFTFSASIIVPNDIESPLFTKTAAQQFQTQGPLTVQVNDVKPPTLFLVAPNQIPQAAPITDIAPPIDAPAPATPDIKALILEGYQPQTITAEVIGRTQSSLPVLSILPTPESLPQNFILQVPAHDIITGSQIEITPQGAATTAGVMSAAITQMPLPAPSYFLIPGQWPLMDDILQSVQQASAQVAQAVSASIPNAASPSQIPPAAMFFIAAIRAGDLSSILGERAQSILRGQGKGGLLSRLTQEGAIINRTEQAPSSEWRSLTIPMAWENEIQKVALHYKHDNQSENDKDNGGKQTRFIFDLSLSRMGKVQLDGLHRGERLNIIVRTETQMSQAMQATMKQAYHDSLATTELSGDLSFQGNIDGWVKINAQSDDHFTEQI